MKDNLHERPQDVGKDIETVCQRPECDSRKSVIISSFDVESIFGYAGRVLAVACKKCGETFNIRY